MRVAFVSDRAINTAGWGRYTVELLRALRVNEQVEPVLISQSPELESDLQGIEHHPILPPILQRRFSTPRSLLAAPALRRVLATCDLVHCLVELYAPLVALARPAGQPFFLAAHGTWAVRPLENPWQRPFFAPALRQANQLICLSHYTCQRVHALAQPRSSMVLTGGVHPEEYQQPAALTLPSWAEGAKIVLTVGGFKTRKGQHVMLDAIARLRARLPDVHYVLIGRFDPAQPYVQGLQAQVQALGLEASVHFLGMVSQAELAAWYQRADVFALTSINDGSSFEGLGLVHLEAQASGTPAIGSRDCGTEDAIIHGETGLLVPQNDPTATAEALLSILQDDQRRARMGAAARKHAARLTWAALARQLLAQYQQATEGPAATRSPQRKPG